MERLLALIVMATLMAATFTVASVANEVVGVTTDTPTAEAAHSVFYESNKVKVSNSGRCYVYVQSRGWHLGVHRNSKPCKTARAGGTYVVSVYATYSGFWHSPYLIY